MLGGGVGIEERTMVGGWWTRAIQECFFLNENDETTPLQLFYTGSSPRPPMLLSPVLPFTSTRINTALLPSL